MQRDEQFNFERYLQAHQEVSQFIDLSTSSQQNNIQNFQQTRTRTHQKLVRQFEYMIEKMHKECTRLASHIKLANTKIPVAQGFVYDRQEDNMKIRISSFLHHKLERSSLKLLHNTYKDINERAQIASLILQMLTKDLIPNIYIIYIKKNLFDLKPNEKRLKHVKMLRAARKYSVEAIESFKLPLWKPNYQSFFHSLVNEALQKVDQELFFFPSLEGEQHLARYLFKTNSKEGRAIDNFISRCALNSFSDFNTRIIPFCSALLPSFMADNTEEQSVALLLYYRAIIDRIYEIRPNLFQPSANYQKQWELTYRPISTFTFPENMVPKFESDISVRKAFSSDPNYGRAARELNAAVFCVNPIDAMYYLHCGMIIIHRGAITNMLGRDPNMDEVQTLLGFDDLFSLLVGTMMASDIPDADQLYELTKVFTPRSCLSPLLEYASANLEAFVTHCKKISSETI